MCTAPAKHTLCERAAAQGIAVASEGIIAQPNNGALTTIAWHANQSRSSAILFLDKSQRRIETPYNHYSYSNQVVFSLNYGPEISVSRG